MSVGCTLSLLLLFGIFNLFTFADAKSPIQTSVRGLAPDYGTVKSPENAIPFTTTKTKPVTNRILSQALYQLSYLSSKQINDTPKNAVDKVLIELLLVAFSLFSIYILLIGPFVPEDVREFMEFLVLEVILMYGHV